MYTHYKYTHLVLLIKGQVAWISEKQRLSVKSSAKASFYDEKLHCVRFYDRIEREIT